MATYKTGTGYDDPEALTRQVQSTAQAMSPAASGNNNLYQAGNNSNTVSHYGQGDLTYNADTGAITRHLNGNSWQVNKGDSKYNDIYSEYVNRYGQPVSNPVQAAVKEKNWNKLLDLVMNLMEEAEIKFADGASQLNLIFILGT